MASILWRKKDQHTSTLSPSISPVCLSVCLLLHLQKLESVRCRPLDCTIPPGPLPGFGHFLNGYRIKRPGNKADASQSYG